MHKYLPIEIVFIPNRVFQNFTRSADPIYFFFSFPLFSFYSVLFYFIFTPGYSFVRGNLEKILITLSSPTLPQPSLPPAFPSNVMKTATEFPRGKVKTTGQGRVPLGQGQSALPRSMIGNLQKSLGGFARSDLRRYVTVQMRGHQMDLRSA